MNYPYPPHQQPIYQSVPVPLPPLPPPPQRPKRTGRLVLFVVLAVVVLCGGAVLGAAAALNHSVNRATATGQGRMNTPVRDDGLEFTVASVSCGKTFEGYGSFTTNAQGQFCEVSVTVRNVGTDARVFAGGLQKAKAADGTTYRDNAEAESRVNSDARTWFTPINPGNQVQGVLVFDIPKSGRIAALELHGGLLSPGAVISVTE